MPTPTAVVRVYLVLLFGNTLAASLIWGINTIFLLDAGLSNFEAFTANAFFTAGMV
ncbi:MAG TPA: MFS transporter, partial [Pedococcus sp.]